MMHHALPRLIDPGRLSNFASDVRYVYRQRNLDKAPGSLVWLLLLAACGGGGGGGGGGPTTSGSSAPAGGGGGTFAKSLTVYDPPIGGAPIWVDVDGDLKISDGDLQLSGKTQSNGDIEVQVPEIYRHKNLIADFRNKAGLQHEGPLKSDFYVAPAESDVISVFTHAFMQAGVAPGRMQGELRSLSSRVGGFDPLRHNPYDPAEQEQALYDPELIKQSLPQLEIWLTTALRPVRGDIAAFRKEVQSAISKIFDRLDDIQQQQQHAQRPVEPVDNPPTGLRIETHQDTLQQDHSGTVHLATIHITDDNLGENRLADLPQSGLVEYRSITHNRAELWLKAGATLHDTAPGLHPYQIALAGGRASGLAKTFTLNITDVDFAPQATQPTYSALLPERPAGGGQPAVDTGVQVGIINKDNDILTYSVDNQAFEMRGNALWLKAGSGLDFETNRNGMVLTITVTDQTPARKFTTVRVDLTIRNVDEPSTGRIEIQPSSDEAGHLAGQPLNVISDGTDPDGVRSLQITWTKDGQRVVDAQGSPVTGPTFTPTEAGTYVAVLTVTDVNGNPTVFSSAAVNVEEPAQPRPSNQPALTVTAPAIQPTIEEDTDDFVPRRIDTGILVQTSDIGVSPVSLVIESQQHDGSWQVDHRFVVANDRLYIERNRFFDFESANNPEGQIRLRITVNDDQGAPVVDTSGDPLRQQVTVQLTNVNESFPGFLSVDGLNANNEVQTGNRVTANTSDITDPDGQPLFGYEWFRDGTKIQDDGDHLTPDQAGNYSVMVTITDPVFHTVTTKEFAFTVTEPQLEPDPEPEPPVTVQPPTVPVVVPQQPQQDPPQVEQPPRIQISATGYEWTEGTAKPTTLARITIVDDSDSEFLVNIAGGTDVRYFEIVRISRTEYELRLKPSTTEQDIPSVAPILIIVGRDMPDADTAKAWFNFTSSSPQAEPQSEDEPEVVEEEDVVVVDQMPTGIRLEPATLGIKEGQALSTALTTVTIIDDGQGFVRLAQLPQSSIFALRQIGTTKFELHLKSGISVDKDLLGSHMVELRALGTGVPSGPMPTQTFTLRVETELTVTEPSEKPAINETVGDATTTARTDTGITVTVDDLGGSLRPLKIENQIAGTWQEDSRFKVSGGRLYIKQGVKIDFEHPGNPGGIITLRVTVTDDTGRNVHREVSVHLSNVNEPATGEVSIQPSATGHQTGQQLTAISQSDDPDGVQQRQITWKKDGLVVNGPDGSPVTGSTFTPTAAGNYQAILTVTDAQGNEQVFRSGIVTVTVREAAPEPNPPEDTQRPAEVPVVPQPPQQQPDSATPQDPVLSVSGTAFLVERRATYEDTPTGLSYTATDPNGDTPTVTLMNHNDSFVLRNGQIFAKAGAELISGFLYELQLQAEDDTGRTVTQTTEVLVKSNLLNAEINEWQHPSGRWADFEEVLINRAVPEKTIHKPWHYNVVPYKLYFPQDKSFDFIIKSNWNGDEFTEDDRFYLPDLISRESVRDSQGGYRQTERSFKFIRVHLNKDFDFEHTRDDGSHLPLLNPANPFNWRKLSLQIVGTDKATGEEYTSQTFYFVIQNVNEPATVVSQARLEEEGDDGTWVTSDGVVDYGQRLRIMDFRVTDPDREPEYYFRWYNPGQSTAEAVRNNVFEPQQSGVYNVEALSVQPGLRYSTISARSEKFTFTVNEVPEHADLKPTDFSLRIDNKVVEIQPGLAALNAGGAGPKNGRIGTIMVEDDGRGTNQVHLTPRGEFTTANDYFDVYLKAGETNIFRIKLKPDASWGDLPPGLYAYKLTVTGSGLGFQPTKVINLGILVQGAAEEASTTASSGSTGLIGQGPPEVDQDFLPGEPLSDDGGMGGVPDIL